jgi:hypothetical protein
MPPNNIYSEQSLRAEIIARIEKIFIDKNWPLPGDDAILSQVSSERNRFNKFCMMCSLLDAEEYNLVLHLAEEFLRCSFNTYPSKLETLLSSIPSEYFDNIQNIFFTPLISPNDYGQAKSSTGMPYFAKTIIKNIEVLRRKRSYYLSDPRELNNYDTRNRSAILFLDDFVGTGDTAQTAIDEYKAHYMKANDIFAILCLVIQQRGYERLSSQLTVFFNEKRNRGISDSETLPDRAYAKLIMEKIESKLAISEKFKFGYGRSESLVSMMITPNNTFPVFWTTNNNWPAPFPR